MARTKPFIVGVPSFHTQSAQTILPNKASSAMVGRARGAGPHEARGRGAARRPPPASAFGAAAWAAGRPSWARSGPPRARAGAGGRRAHGQQAEAAGTGGAAGRGQLGLGTAPGGQRATNLKPASEQ